MEGNKLYAGRPNYIGPTKGWFSFIHHNLLAEFSENIMERVEFIRLHKPRNEVATRLNSIAYLDPAGQPWGYAMAKVDKAWVEFRKTALDLGKADDEVEKAWERYHAAEVEVDKYQLDIDAYIRTLIPDRPWDGKQLVFPKVEGE